MAKRLTSIVRVDTPEVQGEGSWVRVRRANVEEMREKRNNPKEVDAFEMGVALITRHAVDWNWVDDDDKPLPFPSEDPSVIEKLTDPEVAALGKAILGVDDLKNSSEKSSENSG
jgi:hypothetical protein